VTIWKCWKSWAKLTITVTNAHQNVKKERVSQGEIDFSGKGGVGGGGSKMAKSLRKRSSLWSKAVFMDRYWAQMRGIRAHPEQIRASSSVNVIKSDHIKPGLLLPALTARAFREAAVAGRRIVVAALGGQLRESKVEQAALNVYSRHLDANAVA
jgi:hypothetical protein